MKKATPFYLTLGRLLSLVSLCFAHKVYGMCMEQPSVVLVPGNLRVETDKKISRSQEDQNSYFGQHFIAEIKKRFCHVHILEQKLTQGSLSDQATFDHNSLQKWFEEKADRQQESMTLLSHGAGSYRAMALVIKNQDAGASLPIKTIQMLSSPGPQNPLPALNRRNPLPLKQLASLFKKTYPSLQLESFLNFPSEQMIKDLDPQEWPSNVLIYSYGISSTEPSTREGANKKVENLPPMLDAFAFLINEPSDGLVSTRSALLNPFLTDNPSGTQKEKIPFKASLLPFSLNHLEQVMDPDLLVKGSLHDPEWIIRNQTLIIDSLAKDLNQR